MLLSFRALSAAPAAMRDRLKGVGGKVWQQRQCTEHTRGIRVPVQDAFEAVKNVKIRFRDVAGMDEVKHEVMEVTPPRSAGLYCRAAHRRRTLCVVVLSLSISLPIRSDSLDWVLACRAVPF